MTDDRGLTSLDLARGKKMKATLKEAWIEATKGKPALDLAPIRAPSREEVRASVEEFNSKKKGEVIFDVRLRECPKFKRRIVSLITIFLPSKLANIFILFFFFFFFFLFYSFNLPVRFDDFRELWHSDWL
jgi:hypothetical protein